MSAASDIAPYRLSASAWRGDPSACADFGRTGRARISDFLALDSVETLHRALHDSTAWREIINSGAKVFELDRTARATFPAAQRQVLDAAVKAQAATGFQYRYEAIRVRDDGAAGAVPALDRLAAWLNAAESLDWFRGVTGLPEIDFVDAQATAYGAGHFLTEHDDDVAGKNRLAAYVLSLSVDWRPEYGGTLCFPREDGTLEGFVPAFNTLMLFGVPQRHFVSEVASYAPSARLSVTGWLRARG